jgi:hypothetical protein
MSQTDELRAMREAKYARAAAARCATPKPQTKTQTKPQDKAEPKPATKPTGAAPVAPEAAEPATGLCGHRSMNGRTCTREAGHAAKSHRYS